MKWHIAEYLHPLDNYDILCLQVRCCLCILRCLFKIVLPRAIKVGCIPQVIFGELVFAAAAWFACAMQLGAYLRLTMILSSTHFFAGWRLLGLSAKPGFCIPLHWLG